MVPRLIDQLGQRRPSDRRSNRIFQATADFLDSGRPTWLADRTGLTDVAYDGKNVAQVYTCQIATWNQVFSLGGRQNYAMLEHEIDRIEST